MPDLILFDRQNIADFQEPVVVLFMLVRSIAYAETEFDHWTRFRNEIVENALYTRFQSPKFDALRDNVAVL